jgi:hypothetical protein
MKKLIEHIKAFASMMKQKGYDGYFLSSSGLTDKLNNNLFLHAVKCQQEQRQIGPVDLQTYTHWKDGDSPHVHCTFKTDYNDTEGFKVKKLDIDYGIGKDILKRKDISVNANSEIPDKDQLNSMMLQRKRNLRL